METIINYLSTFSSLSSIVNIFPVLLHSLLDAFREIFFSMVNFIKPMINVHYIPVVVFIIPFVVYFIYEVFDNGRTNPVPVKDK
ncbi:MAG: hypothetical protein NTX61_09680 [Bacteroidetes bacterium]|nr:hypothetical protein [Bacteroidota bacterium]